jgi:hypothetical protein
VKFPHTHKHTHTHTHICVSFATPISWLASVSGCRHIHISMV